MLRIFKINLRTSAAILLAASSITAQATDVGNAIRNMGGDEFLINAGDAIRVTCAGLAGLTVVTPEGSSGGQITGRTADQDILFAHCGDMVNEAFFLDPTPGSSPTGQDRYNLGAGSTESYFALIRQFSGEESSTQGRYSTEGINSQFKSIGGRLAAIRSGTRRSGLALNLHGTELLNVAGEDESPPLHGLVGGSAGESNSDSGYGWFANARYGFGERDTTQNENGYDGNSYGLTLGIDYAFDNGLVLGGAFGYDEHEIDFDRETLGSLASVSGGDIEIDSKSIAVFLTYSASAFYVNGIVSYADADFDLSRRGVVPMTASPALSPEISATTESDTTAAQVQVGYVFGKSATTFDLYGGFETKNIDIDGYTETGSVLGLTFGSQQIDSQQGLIGASLRHAFSTKSGVVVPYLTVEARHEFDNDPRSVSARYTLSPLGANDLRMGDNDNFDIPTDEPDEDFLDVSLGLLGQFRNNVALFIQYNGIVGLEDTEANVVTLGIRGTF